VILIFNARDTLVANDLTQAVQVAYGGSGKQGTTKAKHRVVTIKVQYPIRVAH